MVNLYRSALATLTLREDGPEMKEGWFPLSFAQRMFWFLDQLEPDTPAYDLTRVLKEDLGHEPKTVRATPKTRDREVVEGLQAMGLRPGDAIAALQLTQSPDGDRKIQTGQAWFTPRDHFFVWR